MPGRCEVFGHMAPGVILAWENGRLIFIRTTAQLHDIVQGQCKPDEIIVLVGCNSGTGDNSIAQRYAHDYHIPTAGTNRSIWWDHNGHYVGIYGTKAGPHGEPEPDKTDPGHFRLFMP
jgi:hypothetical protein